MWQHPAVFLVLLAIFVLFLLWLVPKILRGLRVLARRLRGVNAESTRT